MSLTAFLPSNVKKHPEDFIGPQVLSGLVQGIELGILLNSVVRFWSRSEKEHPVIKSVIILVLLLALLQTSLSFYSLWRLTVYEFGNWIAVVDIIWADKAQPLLNGLTAAPVQGIFIWRCWKVMGKKWYILLPLATLLTATIVSLVLVTNYIFTFDAIAEFVHPARHLPYTFIMAFVLSAALDIAITVTMSWFVFRAKSVAISQRADDLLRRLVISLWEAAVPPCLCAVAAMFVYVFTADKNFWDLFLQNILGKLYVISLFVVLNSRDESRGLPTTSARITATVSRSSGLFVSSHQRTPSQSIRVHMSTVVDTVFDPETESYEMKDGRGRRLIRREQSTKQPPPAYNDKKEEEGAGDKESSSLSVEDITD